MKRRRKTQPMTTTTTEKKKKKKSPTRRPQCAPPVEAGTCPAGDYAGAARRGGPALPPQRPTFPEGPGAATGSVVAPPTTAGATTSVGVAAAASCSRCWRWRDCRARASTKVSNHDWIARTTAEAWKPLAHAGAAGQTASTPASTPASARASARASALASAAALAWAAALPPGRASPPCAARWRWLAGPRPRRRQRRPYTWRRPRPWPLGQRRWRPASRPQLSAGVTGPELPEDGKTCQER